MHEDNSEGEERKLYIKIRDNLDDCILREAIKKTPPKPYSLTRFTIKVVFEEQSTLYQVNNMGQIIPVPLSRNVIKIIQVINPDTDNCNSWALRVLKKYDELVKKSKMKPLILTISGYFLIIIFIIFTLVFPVSLDSDAWYDWISWMMLILSLILNILCFL